MLQNIFLITATGTRKNSSCCSTFFHLFLWAITFRKFTFKTKIICIHQNNSHDLTDQHYFFKISFLKDKKLRKLLLNNSSLIEPVNWSFFVSHCISITFMTSIRNEMSSKCLHDDKLVLHILSASINRMT